MLLLFVTSPLKLLSETHLGSDRMMCFQAFIFLLSIGALLSDDNYEDHHEDKYTDFYEDEKKWECLAEKEGKCNDILLEVKFPETADELLAYCKTRASDCSCRIQAEEECEFVLIPDWEQDKLNFIETVCDKDNPIFKVISENLQCIKEYKKYEGLCDALRMRNEKFSSVRELETRLWDEDVEAGLCLSIQLLGSCEPIIIGYTCNNLELKEAAKVVRKFGRNIPECTPENMEKVNPILEEFEAILLEEARSYE